MRKFRIIGDANKSMIIFAYTHLDAGARWIANAPFYNIGTLIATEDLGYDPKIQKKSSVIIPFRTKANKEKKSSCGTISHATTVGKRITIKRERSNARVQFGF